MHLRTGDSGHQWQPTLIDQNVMFAAELAAIGWISTSVLTTEWRRHAGNVDNRPPPNDLVGLSETPKYNLMKVLPNTGLHPSMEPMPAGHTAPHPSSHGR